MKVFDLADYGVRATGKSLRIAFNFAQVFPFQAFGGKLYRGQRIFDFMGNAPGDIGPGRFALSGKQFRHVVEGYDITDNFVSQPLGSDSDH